MPQTITLTPDQHRALRSLKDIIKPAALYAPDTVQALHEQRLIRILSGDKLAISNIGLDYLLTQPEPFPAAPPEPFPAEAPVALSSKSLDALQRVANSEGGIAAHHFHPMTVEKLVKLRLLKKRDDLLTLTEAGLDRLRAENGTPAANGAQPPAAPELPPSTDPAPAVSLEISVESDTVPEAVARTEFAPLHEIAAAVADALATNVPAQSTNPDYDPHIDELLAKPVSELTDDDRRYLGDSIGWDWDNQRSADDIDEDDDTTEEALAQDMRAISTADWNRPFEAISDDELWNYAADHRIDVMQHFPAGPSRAEMVALLYRIEGTTPGSIYTTPRTVAPPEGSPPLSDVLNRATVGIADFSHALACADDDCTSCLKARVLDLLMAASPEIASVYERQAAIDRSMAKIRSIG